MEKHSLIGLAYLKNVTNLLGSQAFNVPQGHYRALVERQLLQGALQAEDCLFMDELLFRALVREAPRGLVRVEVLQRRKRNRPGLANQARLGPVGEDTADPSLEAGPTLERGQAVDDSGPGVLNDFFGEGPVRIESQGKPQQDGVVAANELAKGRFIPGA